MYRANISILNGASVTSRETVQVSIVVATKTNRNKMSK